MLPREVFLDTAYAIALSTPADEHHELAIELAEEIEAGHTRLITTRATMIEIGNALAQFRYRRSAVQLLRALEQDPNVEIIPLTELSYERAFRLFRERPDKEWGLTDCVSFVVMAERGLTAALTTDEHFQQAGFQALLREKT
ncbi:MAG: type II toxin-antitoxin system VapC family toxin [Planctomycetes bacterium]|nr:type II toxin-antitoxin system VapC family toxin [Planctomycetota bacterium]